jgi:tRNA A-37 threonylcarbamoyl transferase component Bud32
MSGYLSIRFGDVHWRVRADAADSLFDREGLRLPTWLRGGQASIVKQGPHRTVYRVQLPERSVYVKHYRVADTRAMLSQWAQSSKGRREWNRIAQAAGSSIPTPVPLALGEQRRAGLVLENFLVTEGIEGVEQLDQFVQLALPRISEPDQSRARRRLAEELAELAARAHDAGIINPDLHSGNVLVRQNGSDLELFLIDLHAAAAASRLGWRRSRGDLLALGIDFLTLARGVDRARFLRHYVRLRRELGFDWKEVAADLHDALWHRARRHWRKLDYRCVSNNRRFFYRNIGVANGYAVTELGEATLLALLRDPDAPFRNPAAVVIKESPSTSVIRLPMAVDGRSTEVIYKRFNCPTWVDRLKATLHHSPALRAWQAGHGLLNRRVPTPRPLAVIERTPHVLVRETYVITQALSDSMNLRDYMIDVVAHLPADERRRRVRFLVRAVARLVRQMHDRYTSHRDLKAANFLVTTSDADDEHPQLQLIDLAGVQIWRRLPKARRVQNLARLLLSLFSCPNVTRSDGVRFLRAYQPGRSTGSNGWKQLWRELEPLMLRKIEKNRSLSRPLT